MGLGQAPRPSHVTAAVATPSVQFAAPHDSDAPGTAQALAFVPSHEPPQLPWPAERHAGRPARGAPETATQRPSLPGSAQAVQTMEIIRKVSCVCQVWLAIRKAGGNIDFQSMIKLAPFRIAITRLVERECSVRQQRGEHHQRHQRDKEAVRTSLEASRSAIHPSGPSPENSWARRFAAPDRAQVRVSAPWARRGRTPKISTKALEFETHVSRWPPAR